MSIAAEAVSVADTFLRSTHRLLAKPVLTTVINDTSEDVRCNRCIAARAGVRRGDRRLVRLRVLRGGSRPDVFSDLTDREGILGLITTVSQLDMPPREHLTTRRCNTRKS